MSYPDENTWWNTFTTDVNSRYLQAQHPLDDGRFKWFARTAYDIGDGLSHDASRAKHLRELEQALGLPSPEPPPVTVERLRVQGRRFVKPDGSYWHWRGISAFKLLALSEAEQEAYLAWCAANGVTLVRVFTRCRNLFVLKPEDGRRLLPKLCTLAARYGIYVEAVALVDTFGATDDLELHLREVEAACIAEPNAFLEGANEPRHPTQDARVVGMVKLFPAGMLYAPGAAHGEDDENPEFAQHGALATIHFNRKDSAWNEVRHRREGELISGEFDKPVIDDEPVGASDQFIPGKRDNNPARFFARGVLNRILRLGATFHSDAGLQAKIPSGRELDCFTRWRQGLDLIPSTFNGQFQNATWTGSPVGKFDETKALRIYSATEGDRGYTESLDDRGVTVPWQNGWGPVALIGQDEGVRVWEIARG